MVKVYEGARVLVKAKAPGRVRRHKRDFRFAGGVRGLFGAPAADSANLMAATGTLGGLLVLLGSLGLAAATMPMAYERRREDRLAA